MQDFARTAPCALPGCPLAADWLDLMVGLETRKGSWLYCSEYYTVMSITPHVMAPLRGQ